MSHDEHFNGACPTCGQSCWCDWLALVKFCGIEIANQQDSPGCVIDMVEAWLQAQRWATNQSFPTFTLANIQWLGWRVKPVVNVDGQWRRVNLLVADPVPRYPFPDFQEVPRLMQEWHEAVVEARFTPEEAYKAFEEIHPFRDGNGRTGKIIYNWLGRTLDNPTMPPKFWGGVA